MRERARQGQIQYQPEYLFPPQGCHGADGRAHRQHPEAAQKLQLGCCAGRNTAGQLTRSSVGIAPSVRAPKTASRAAITAASVPPQVAGIAEGLGKPRAGLGCSRIDANAEPVRHPLTCATVPWRREPGCERHATGLRAWWLTGARPESSPCDGGRAWLHTSATLEPPRCWQGQEFGPFRAPTTGLKLCGGAVTPLFTLPTSAARGRL